MYAAHKLFNIDVINSESKDWIKKITFAWLQ